MTKAKAAAFFDLDRTLIDTNSAILYARHERKEGRLSLFQMMRTLYHSMLYHFNRLDMESAYEKALEHYKGVRAEELQERTHEFFHKLVKPRLQPGAERALTKHRDLGHPLVVLSTSSCYQADIAARTWGLDDWIANRFHVEDGYVVGTVVKPLCYADGKVVWARRWAEQKGIDLAESYFYSDSYSDLPMLEAVGYPVVVNPDPKLRIEAQRRQWPIVDWKA